MMRTTTLRKELAIKAYGSNWYVDSANSVLRENLGPARPTFHFGDNFPTLDAALVAGYDRLSTVPLPEEIVLPTQSPVCNVKQHNEVNQPITRMTVMLFDDLLNKGIQIQERTISVVEFSIPSPDLIDVLDFVPTAVWLTGDPILKVNLSYNRDGRLSVSGNPMTHQGFGYAEWTKCMAFFHREDAENEADRLAERLINAANWRSRAVLLPRKQMQSSAA